MDNLTDNRQSQPAAAIGTAAGRLHPVKSLENPVDMLLIDTAGKMAFDVEKEVPVENNTDNLSDLMLRSN